MIVYKEENCVLGLPVASVSSRQARRMMGRTAAIINMHKISTLVPAQLQVNGICLFQKLTSEWQSPVTETYT